MKKKKYPLMMSTQVVFFGFCGLFFWAGNIGEKEDKGGAVHTVCASHSARCCVLVFYIFGPAQNILCSTHAVR